MYTQKHLLSETYVAVNVWITWLAPGVPSNWLPSNMCSGLAGWEKLTWPSFWLINMASQQPAAKSGWELENCILSSLWKEEDSLWDYSAQKETELKWEETQRFDLLWDLSVASLLFPPERRGVGGCFTPAETGRREWVERTLKLNCHTCDIRACLLWTSGPSGCLWLWCVHLDWPAAIWITNLGKKKKVIYEQKNSI